MIEAAGPAQATDLPTSKTPELIDIKATGSIRWPFVLEANIDQQPAGTYAMHAMRFYLRDCMAWGLGLWLFGFVLGIVYFFFMPAEMIGWFITPVGLVFMGFVLWKWVHVGTLTDGVMIGMSWAVIAIVLDYIFIVRLLHPIDGYYKLDVYLYYASTLLAPVIAASLNGNKTMGLPD
jgi:hypothetical protein